MFGGLSRPAVTRFAAERSCSAPARVNLGGVTLERDCRSAARDAVTGASRRSPAVLKSQPDEFPGERPPRGHQEENRRQGCEADSVPAPMVWAATPQYVHPSGANGARQLPAGAAASLRRQNRSTGVPSPARAA